MICTNCDKAIDPTLDLLWSGRVLDVYQCDCCLEVRTQLRGAAGEAAGQMRDAAPIPMRP